MMIDRLLSGSVNRVLAAAIAAALGAGAGMAHASEGASKEKPAEKAAEKAAEKTSEKAPAKAAPPRDSDRAIEEELRKALIGKSSIAGDLLLKTGVEGAAKADGAKPAAKAAAKVAKSEKDEKGEKADKAEKSDKAKSESAERGTGSVPLSEAARAPKRMEAVGGAHKAAAMPGHGEHGAKVAAAGHGHGTAPHWGYEGAAGPDAWAKLSAEFEMCGKGMRQSPIDIVDGEVVPLGLEQVRFEYGPSRFTVRHNGHTIEVANDGANSIVARGKTYRLVQFHFHHPAEEKINQKSFALNAHFVHKAEDGELAVVSAIFDVGAENAALQKVWDHMPLDSGDKVRSADDVVFDPSTLFPADRSKYVQYLGSLTTPPCTEGVVFIVLRDIQTVSPAQVALFRRLVGVNARPVQPLNGRLIKGTR